ncbi:hypothetical protein C2857_006575 [Epichloe festucae Fl1]|uniref:ubiquitinyl hydrolase 1 n=1 Tax=Epichloe festucae (strain Fl1) TaxID=877507 RepID=A0A7S9KTL0_EPIFF|nr:hypothetical protein C2857_006575 [Epichloe festucae Fl1]
MDIITKNSKILRCIINHVFLPRRLPNKPDEVEFEGELLALLLDSLSQYRSLCLDEQVQIDNAQQGLQALQGFQGVRDPINQHKLHAAFQKVGEQELLGFPVYIRPHNAGLLVQGQRDTVELSMWELTPDNSTILSVKGRLVRHFPDVANSIPTADFKSSNFLKFISTTLANMTKMSHQDKTQHGRSSQDQDTIPPAVITELLHGYLHGTFTSSSGCKTRKNTREEVIWAERNEVPWRRSSFWLFLRVSLQFLMANRATFKKFMIFFMSRILQKALDTDLESDMIFCMIQKLSGRQRKLCLTNDENWMEDVTIALDGAHALLNERWEDIIKADANFNTVKISPIDSDALAADTLLKLPELDAFISSIDTRQSARPVELVPQSRRSDLSSFEPEDLPLIPCLTSNQEYFIFKIFAFEVWTARNLDDWLADRIADQSTCSQLHERAAKYFRAAMEIYKNSPRELSSMLLIILELWIACDKSAAATTQSFGFNSFSPPIPSEIWTSLLLSSKADVSRLLQVRHYLTQRQESAEYESSALWKIGKDPLFAEVAFANADSGCKDQLKAFKADSERRKKAKINDLEIEKSRFDSLMEEYASKSCECERGSESDEDEDQDDEDEDQEDELCERCRCRKKAEAMKIWPLELPLPSCETEQKVMTCEFLAPLSFRSWRDFTIFLRTDILGVACMNQKLRDHISFTEFAYQEGWKEKPSGEKNEVKDRVILSSTTAQTRQMPLKINPDLGKSDVCRPTSLKWQYVDKISGSCLKYSPITTLPRWLTVQVTSSATSLQAFLEQSLRPNRARLANSSIAEDNPISNHMSKKEFRSIATLALSDHTRWTCLLRELAQPTINLRFPETALALFQIITQSPETATSQLSCKTFNDAMLSLIEEKLEMIRGNWESSLELWILSLLLLRLISEGPAQFRTRGLSCLDKCRDICRGWIRQLHSEASMHNQDSSNILSKAAHVALICVQTFNLDLSLLESTLQIESHSEVFLECSITINRHVKITTVDSCDQLQSILALAWKRTTYLAWPVLQKRIVQTRCLDTVLQEMQCASNILGNSGQWETENKDWVRKTYPENETSSGQIIQYNLLTGEVLVDGLPSMKIPSEFGTHEEYHTLFGQSQLEVHHSSEPGMQYQLNCPFQQYHVSLDILKIEDSSSTKFGEGQNDLAVVASKDGQRYDLIPQRVLKGILPLVFTRDYAHWFHEDQLSFRAKTNPWAAAECEWQLQNHGDSWQLIRSNGGILINPSSETAAQFLSVFRSLAQEEDIFILYFSSDQHIEVHLPNLQLEFMAPSGSEDLFSRQYPGFRVDKCQDIGTLIGLKQKLVLVKNTLDRIVMVPGGAINPDASTNHQHANIAIDTSHRCDVYYTYELDPYLGRLVGHGMESKLRLSYLHALTSFCLRDPFTGFTGTERALAILQSAEVRSIRSLSPISQETLLQLSALSGTIELATSDDSSRQNISWVGGISSLSHHPGFRIITGRIQPRFYPSNSPNGENLVRTPKERIRNLYTRAAIRYSPFYCWGAETSATITATLDYIYPGRLHEEKPMKLTDCKGKIVSGDSSNEKGSKVELSRFQRVVAVSQTTKRNSEGPHLNCFKLAKTPKQFVTSMVNALKGSATTLTVGLPRSHGRKEIDLSYDSKWLQDPSDFLPEKWFSIYSAFSDLNKNTSTNPYITSFYLATLAFAQKPNIEAIQILNAIQRINPRTALAVPDSKTFDLHKKTKATIKDLLPIVSRATHRLFKEKKPIADAFKAQWEAQPTTVPTWPPAVESLRKQLDSGKLLSGVQKYFVILTDNLNLEKHFEELYVELKDMVLHSPELPAAAGCNETDEKQANSAIVSRSISIHSIFEFHPPIIPDITYPQGLLDTFYQAHDDQQLQSLTQLLQQDVTSKLHEKYVNGLRNSIQQLGKASPKLCLAKPNAEVIQLVEELRGYAQYHREEFLDSIRRNLYRPDSNGGLDKLKVAAATSQLPPVCAYSLLQQLMVPGHLPPRWKVQLTRFADRVTQVQSCDRILKATKASSSSFLKELQCLRPRQWDIEKHPEWLLFEVENNLRIRDTQAEVAQEVMSPRDAKNSILQLNMGEGKSSVIIPIMAASLTSGSNLVCVIASKPQAEQMFELLRNRLGGLLNRPIFVMPLSRSIRLTEAVARHLRDRLYECRESRGVLFLQPEHMLSLFLMASDSEAKHGPAVKEILFEITAFLHKHCREIMDESDEIFSPKFELVYPLGKQQSVDFALERQSIITQILALAGEQAALAMKEDPAANITVTSTHMAHFPRIILNNDLAVQRLNQLVAGEVCNAKVRGFKLPPKFRDHRDHKDQILEFVTKMHPSQEAVQLITNLSSSSRFTRSLYLIRGLLACGVLAGALQDRYRVDYGLDKKRKPKTDLAVPYQAKDTPAVGSEYSHPDNIIVKTLLAYYYQGLDDYDIKLAIAHLLDKSDNAQDEYNSWFNNNPEFPRDFQDVNSINIQDNGSCKRIFPHLKFSPACINYFLMLIIFPSQLKEHTSKVSASGWHLGRVKDNPATGFSGTHDSQHILPLSVVQQDLASQQHTDALVLEKMLSTTNSVLLLGSHTQQDSNEVSSEILQHILREKPDIRVVIDVGALFIDLTNEQVARLWLQMLTTGTSSDIKGVVYFHDNKLKVRSTGGQVKDLSTSPLSDNLGTCLVYLDEAHTRGTDLKLPSDYQAAVTLGRGLTKDKLAQACMRMRLLGEGQTVTFCVPAEIQGQMTTTAGDITLLDIGRWVIQQTWKETTQHMTLWEKQGCEFQRQSKLWEQINGANDMDVKMRHLRTLKQDYTETIEDLYRPRDAVPKTEMLEPIDPIAKRRHEFGVGIVNNFNGCEERQQEQELEVQAQVQEQRNVVQPPAETPAKHELHDDVRSFVKNGILRPPRGQKGGIFAAFATLSDTTAGTFFDFQYASSLKVSSGFATTIKRGGTGGKLDAYKREVQFILTTADGDGIVNNMLLISPLEAEDLYEMIIKSSSVALHVYAPRQNSRHAPIDHLQLYVVPGQAAAKRRIPVHLQIELNLFAGQLYFDTFKEYVNVCEYLGLAWNDSFKTADVDGFIPPGSNTRRIPNRLNAQSSPLPFLKLLMTNIRNYGSNIDKTHMGRMLDGEFLTEKDFSPRMKRERDEDDTEDADAGAPQPAKKQRRNGGQVIVKTEDQEMAGMDSPQSR